MLSKRDDVLLGFSSLSLGLFVHIREYEPKQNNGSRNATRSEPCVLSIFPHDSVRIATAREWQNTLLKCHSATFLCIHKTEIH